jgi:hypothetical protein
VTRSRLVTGLTAAFASMSLVLAVLGVLYNPVVLVVAVLFGAVTYFFWEHATGKLAARLYRQVERQAARNDGRTAAAGNTTAGRGGFGAGPRDEWAGPYQRDGRDRTRRTRRPPSRNGDDGPSPAQAYRVLDLDPGADERAVKRAYREKVQQVHPDTDGGDEESFKRVNDAYETLTDG